MTPVRSSKPATPPAKPDTVWFLAKQQQPIQRPAPNPSATGHAQTVTHSARKMGCLALASKGAGKSTLLAMIAWQDYISGTPQCILDPIGGTVDAFLHRVLRFLQHIPKELHEHFWKRIVYVDVSGQDGFIVPFPLYYKLGRESLREVAERFLQVILMTNPSLLNAQVQGWPPLHRIGVYTGMVLFALDLQITSAVDLLRHPEQWVGRFAEAQARYPEVAEAVAFFKNEYIPMRPQARERLVNTFLDKVFPFTIDPRLQAMFGASQPGIVWSEVERKKQTVLLDFRQEQDQEMRRFKLLWAFSYLYEWIKRRGRGATPFGLSIDEFANLAQSRAAGFAGENPLASLLDEFINVYMRQHSIFFTCAFQELFQIIDEQLRNTLLSLGTYIIGRQASMQACRILADHLFLNDPYRVKHYRKVWGNADPRSAAYFVLDTEPQFLPLAEQQELFAQRIKTQRLFQFLLRPAEREGAVSSSVIPISIASVDRDKETGEWLFPNQTVLSRLRPLLAQASSKPIAALLAPKPDSALPPQTTRKVQLSGVTGNSSSQSS